MQVPVEDNVYTRFAGYSLLGSVVAPLVGAYASFVLVNVLLWVAAALATYALALRYTGSALTATLAALLVSTAPAFEALAGQALPYVASYSLFVLGLWLFDRASLFARSTSMRTALACGLVGGLGFVFYDLYMLPAFVVAYGLFRRMPLRNLALVLVGLALPRLAWSGYWQVAHLASYSHNETHPAEALAAWFDPARMGQGVSMLKAYALLAAHGLLNIGAAFLFWPVLLALFELGGAPPPSLARGGVVRRRRGGRLCAGALHAFDLAPHPALVCLRVSSRVHPGGGGRGPHRALAGQRR